MIDWSYVEYIVMDLDELIYSSVFLRLFLDSSKPLLVYVKSYVAEIQGLNYLFRICFIFLQLKSWNPELMNITGNEFCVSFENKYHKAYHLPSIMI